MSRALTLLAVLVLLSAVSLSWASVTITSPAAGSTVGPSTVVTGAASQRAFLVVYSDVFAGEESLGMVPGIRHWTNDDDSYNVRISTPRLYLRAGEQATQLTYIIHVKAYTAAPRNASASPDLGEATVTVYSAQ